MKKMKSSVTGPKIVGSLFLPGSFIIAALLIILSCGFISNTSAQWLQKNNGMGNKSVLSLVSKGNKIFAGTSLFGVYSSTDNGENWIPTSLNDRVVWTLYVDGNNIFAGTSFDGIYLSTDDGISWTQKALPERSVYSIKRIGNTIFAGLYFYGIYYSTDNGSSWAPTAFNNVFALAFAEKGSNIFLGSAYNGIYTSTNNGFEWTQSALGNQSVEDLIVNGNSIYAGAQNGVYISTDDGTSWVQSSLNNVSIGSFEIFEDKIFAGTFENGVYQSTVNMKSWVQKNEGLGEKTVRSLLVFNNFIFAGTNANGSDGFGVYRRNLDEILSVQPVSNEIPDNYMLLQNYPNPFNPSTIIKFAIPNHSKVSIIIYDIAGREIRSILKDSELNPGTFEITFDGSGLASGVYIYSMFADGNMTGTKKMLLIK